MIMTAGQSYRCQNPDCRCEIQVTKTSMEARANPRCCCGAEMKKPYNKPVFKALDTHPDFLAEFGSREAARRK